MKKTMSKNEFYEWLTSLNYDFSSGKCFFEKFGVSSEDDRIMYDVFDMFSNSFHVVCCYLEEVWFKDVQEED